MKTLDKLFLKMLDWYCKNRLDQWERWKVETKFGPVYVEITRVSDGCKYEELEATRKELIKTNDPYYKKWSIFENIEIKDFSEVEKNMTDEQKLEANEAFRRVYPEETPEIMCVSEVPEGVNYLKPVDLDLLK